MTFDCSDTMFPYTLDKDMYTKSCLESCPAGYYSTSSKKCAQCSIGYSECTSSEFVSVCASENLGILATCVECTSNCADSSTYIDNCIACDAGYVIVQSDISNSSEVVGSPGNFEGQSPAQQDNNDTYLLSIIEDFIYLEDIGISAECDFNFYFDI